MVLLRESILVGNFLCVIPRSPPPHPKLFSLDLNLGHVLLLLMEVAFAVVTDVVFHEEKYKAEGTLRALKVPRSSMYVPVMTDEKVQ